MDQSFLKPPKITKRVLTIQNKKQTIAYIYIILTLATVSFFGFFALRPAFSIIANLQKQLADNKVVLSALSEKLSALQSLDNQYRQLEPNLELIYDAIPTSAQAAPVVRQVEKLAQQNNLTISTLDTGVIDDYPLDKTDATYSFTFTITASGTEVDTQAFLEDLVTFDRVIGLNRVTTEKNETGLVESTIEGIAYFLPNPK